MRTVAKARRAAPARFGLAAAPLLLALLLAGPLWSDGSASAHRSPNRREAAALIKALRASPATGAVRCFRVRGILISSAGPWARARIFPCQKRGDVALVVLQHRRGRWAVRDIGTAETGCTVAPLAVRRDLKLTC